MGMIDGDDRDELYWAITYHSLSVDAQLSCFCPDRYHRSDGIIFQPNTSYKVNRPGTDGLTDSIS